MKHIHVTRSGGEKYPSQIARKLMFVEKKYAQIFHAKLLSLQDKYAQVVTAVMNGQPFENAWKSVFNNDDFYVNLNGMLMAIREAIRWHKQRTKASLIGKAVNTQFATSFDIEPDEVQFVQMLRNRSDELAKLLNDTSQNEASRIIESGLREGLTFQEIGSNLDSIYGIGMDRAKRIARTETNMAINTGIQDYDKSLGFEELELNIADDACDECRNAADAGPQSVEDAYNRFADLGAFHNNCRCILVPVIPKDWTSDGVDTLQPMVGDGNITDVATSLMEYQDSAGAKAINDYLRSDIVTTADSAIAPKVNAIDRAFVTDGKKITDTLYRYDGEALAENIFSRTSISDTIKNFTNKYGDMYETIKARDGLDALKSLSSQIGKNMVGIKFLEPAYTSTSLSKDVVNSQFFRADTVLNSNALPSVWHIEGSKTALDIGTLTGTTYESEMLLPRNTWFEIKDVALKTIENTSIYDRTQFYLDVTLKVVKE